MSTYDIEDQINIVKMIPKALVAASIKPFVLTILASGDSYGYAIIQRVKTLTGEQITWTTSTLYPVLHSLENKGYLESYWQSSEGGPRRKYYHLTAKGQKVMQQEKQQWLDVHAALMKLWNPAPGLFPA